MAVAAILVQNDDKEANARDIFASNLGPKPWSIPFCLFCLFFFRFPFSHEGECTRNSDLEVCGTDSKGVGVHHQGSRRLDNFREHPLFAILQGYTWAMEFRLASNRIYHGRKHAYIYFWGWVWELRKALYKRWISALAKMAGREI